MRRRPPRSTPLYSSAASDVYKRQVWSRSIGSMRTWKKEKKRSLRGKKNWRQMGISQRKRGSRRRRRKRISQQRKRDSRRRRRKRRNPLTRKVQRTWRKRPRKKAVRRPFVVYGSCLEWESLHTLV